MRMPNVLALFTSCLLLSANVTADFNDGLAAYQTADYETAISEWKPLAEQGDVSAQVMLWLMYEDLGDSKEAARWQTKAAVQGHADAQSELGRRYYFGKGVLQDYKEAARWFSAAAEQGHALAQTSLGALFSQGQGVPEDYKAAAMWFSRAAEQGETSAQARLGNLYSLGEGIIRDDVYAHMWLNIAVSNGQDDARIFLDGVSERMTRDQLAEAQSLARECVKKDYKNC